jgi:TolA-binding protein
MASDHEPREPNTPPAADAVTTTTTDSVRPADAPAPPPAAKPQPADLPPAPSPSSFPLWTTLLASVVLSLACGAAGAWAYENYLAKKSPPPEERTASQPSQPAASPARPVADSASDSKIDEMVTRLDRLRKDVNELQKREDNPDLVALRNRVEKIETGLAASDPKDKVEDLDKQVEGLDKSVESLREDVATLKDQVAASRGAAGSSSTTRRVSARPAATDGDKDKGDGQADQDLGRGATLFHEGKYDAALQAFQDLQQSRPDDARVWYYSALANGLANRKWDGDTLRWVRKGAQLEKDGKPSKDRIDAAFSDLPKTTKEWLDYYRKHSGS